MSRTRYANGLATAVLEEVDMVSEKAAKLTLEAGDVASGSSAARIHLALKYASGNPLLKRRKMGGSL